MADCCAADAEGSGVWKSGAKAAVGFFKGVWPTPPFAASAEATKEGIIF